MAVSPAAAPAALASSAAQEWEVEPSELRLTDLLGSGATAQVYRGSWHGTDVAVKKLLRGGSLSQEFHREVLSLLRLRHPNLVLFMGASTRSSPPLIVTEFCAGGTVFALLHEKKDVHIAWTQRLKMAADVAKGMNFLHVRQVVHRDLKSLNLLLSGPVIGLEEAPCVKISDFGLSRALSRGQQGEGAEPFMTSGAGTYHWMAPEVLHGRSYNEKVDVYSYGVWLFELAARRVPYEGSGLEGAGVALAACQGRRPNLSEVPPGCPPDLRLVMECCWAQQASDRPGFDTVLETLKLIQS